MYNKSRFTPLFFKPDRRNFLKTLGKLAAGLISLFPLGILHSKTIGQAVKIKTAESKILLRNGLIVDGTGEQGFRGDVLITEEKILSISKTPIEVEATTIDCTGKVVSPGFIDMHSHMDWLLPFQEYPRLFNPFIDQGITTFVGGNCGFGTGGFVKGHNYQTLIEPLMYGLGKLEWNTMDEYFNFLESRGISHNLVNLAGHGTTRVSIRGFDASPMSGSETRQMHTLIETALEEGAAGLSFGLQYEPGLFAGREELVPLFEMVRKHDKPITVHGRAYSSMSATYPLKLFGEPHNIIALKEMLNLARDTGVRLQYSHLIFAGKRTWRSYDEALELIDNAVDQGVDVKFDTYPYHCGGSIINVFLPDWFLQYGDEAYENKRLLRKLKLQLSFIEKVLGFGYDQIQITDANNPELEQYNGKFLSEIARMRNMPEFDNFVEFARSSKGRARVINHRYSNPELVKDLMKHPAALFMTDATPTLKGVQNPGAYGAFPLLLQRVRDEKFMTLEEAIYKMSGAAVERFKIPDRGILTESKAADIVVFDYARIKDNNNLYETDKAPDGIEHVLINGRLVKSIDKETISNAGQVVRINSV